MILITIMILTMINDNEYDNDNSNDKSRSKVKWCIYTAPFSCNMLKGTLHDQYTSSANGSRFKSQ